MELYVEMVETFQQKVLGTKIYFKNTYQADGSWLHDRTKVYKYKW